MKKTPVALSLICATCFMASDTAHATVVINNLTGGTQGFAASLSGPDALDFFGGAFDNREFAFSFTTSQPPCCLPN